MVSLCINAAIAHLGVKIISMRVHSVTNTMVMFTVQKLAVIYSSFADEAKKKSDKLLQQKRYVGQIKQ